MQKTLCDSHNVSNLDDVTSPLQILESDNSFEIYGSNLGCRSLWDTLYTATVPCCNTDHARTNFITVLLYGTNRIGWDILCIIILD